ncbi:MAG: GNAT family N-acetyltransferase [Gemmatimonas sp.]
MPRDYSLPISIRRATPHDAPHISALTQTIQALHAAALPHVFKPADAHTFSVPLIRELLAESTSVMLVAEHDARIVGHAYAERQSMAESSIKFASRRLLVHQLAVDPEWRQRGIGTRLLDAVCDVATSHGIATIALDVWDFNVAAKALYAAYGFSGARQMLTLDLSGRRK